MTIIEKLTNKMDISEQDMVYIKCFDADLQLLLHKSNHDLNQYINLKGLFLPEELNCIMKKILLYTPFVFRIVDNDMFFNELRQTEYYIKEDNFWQWFQQCVVQLILQIKEMDFLEDIDQKQLEDITRFCFDNYILSSYKDIIEPYNLLKKEEISVIIKLLRTIEEEVITYNINKIDCKEFVYLSLNVSDKHFEMIWKLIEKNKNDLQFKRLMYKIENLEVKVGKTIENLTDEVNQK